MDSLRVLKVLGVATVKALFETFKHSEGAQAVREEAVQPGL